MKRIFFSVLLFSAIAAYAQSGFEGVISLSTYSQETQDKATTTWFMKDGNHKLLISGVASEKSYSSAVFFLKGDDQLRLVSEIGGETGIYAIPVAQVESNVPFTEGKLAESKGTKTVGGYHCTSVVFEMPEGTATFWMADEVKIGWEELPVLLRTKGVFRLLQDNGIKGFPAEVVVTDANGQVIFSQTIQSISKTAVSNEEFKIPADVKSGEELLKKSVKTQ